MSARNWLLFVYLFVCLAHSCNGQVVACTFDPNCYLYATGCALYNCPSFNRSTPISCEQCMRMCEDRRTGNGPNVCKSIVYDCATRTCDLFSMDETTYGRLRRMPNKFYFRPTGKCAGVAPPPTGCPAGKVAKIIQAKNHQSAGFTGTSMLLVDEQGCAQACLTSQLPGGGAFDCRSAQFKDGQCVLSTGAATAGQIQTDPGSSYFQKFCFDVGSVTDCPDVFQEEPQMILVGQNRQTVDSQSLQDCVQQCLYAYQKYGFRCNSAEFYYNVKTQNCILNDETKYSRPDLFSAFNDDKVTYIEPGCGGLAGSAGGSARATSGPATGSVRPTSGGLVTLTTPSALTTLTSGLASPLTTVTNGPTDTLSTESPTTADFFFSTVTVPTGGSILSTLASAAGGLGKLLPQGRLRDFGKAKNKAAFDRAFLDLPMNGGAWSQWSPCRPGLSSMSYRYRQCRKMDPLHCEKEDRPCGTATDISDPKNENDKPLKRLFTGENLKLDDSILTVDPDSTCRALTFKGQKKCPLGVRMVSGIIRYCAFPVDC